MPIFKPGLSRAAYEQEFEGQAWQERRREIARRAWSTRRERYQAVRERLARERGESLLTAAQASERTGARAALIAGACESGTLPAVRIRGQWAISETALAGWMATRAARER